MCLHQKRVIHLYNINKTKFNNENTKNYYDRYIKNKVQKCPHKDTL